MNSEIFGYFLQAKVAQHTAAQKACKRVRLVTQLAAYEGLDPDIKVGLCAWSSIRESRPQVVIRKSSEVEGSEVEGAVANLTG